MVKARRYAVRTLHGFAQYLKTTSANDRKLALESSIASRLLALFAAVKRFETRGQIDAPVYGIKSFTYVTMKRRIRPIGHRGYQSVFDRVEMQVIQMLRIIAFVT